ncbi:MAG TPA: RNA polymerase subunit sigma-24 [candidate division Zixibacteria bacterium]|jgi:RNA polymerase sigma-70 factor (ECF subfamily)|nr:RNA polymerase subunit sigma-24 [candidate division Zixibacteria bacterium]
MAHNPDDAALVGRCLGGDNAAFDKLISRYKRQVFSVIYRMVRNPADAEDLAQDTFIKAFRALSSYDPKFPFITWLFKIAHNTAIDHLRSNKAQVLSLDIEESPLQDECFDQTLMDSIDALSDKSMIDKALATLPPVYREILALRHQQEFSYSEISEALGIPEGTVKIRLFRARNLMKEKMLTLGYPGP